MVEVIYGVTALYSGGSTDGLINIVTRKGQPENPLEFEAGLRTGFKNGKDHGKDNESQIIYPMDSVLKPFARLLPGKFSNTQ